MRSMLIAGSKGQVLVERDERGHFVVSQMFATEKEARAFAISCAHPALTALAGWEMDADTLHGVEAQIAQAHADRDEVLAAALRQALLDAAMREIAQGHPQARDVARAVVHVVDSMPDVTGAAVVDMRKVG